ncbi:MAG: hypothetical protein V1701_07485 [Planctomycetota bacterium]
MAYKSFKGKWQVFGDKPAISILTTGQICFNKACYESFVKPADNPAGYKYVKLYYDAEMKKIAFQLFQGKAGEFVLPINLTKTGLVAVVNGKTFLEHFGIKYQGLNRSYPVHQTTIHETSPGYKRIRKGVKGIEIHLTEYLAD